MTSLADIQAKLVAAQNCHPAAVQTLIAEALDRLGDVALARAVEAAEAYLRDPETRLRQEIQRFALIGDPGTECVRSGHGYWELHRNGELVCPLSPQSRQFIDSAIGACRGLSSSA